MSPSRFWFCQSPLSTPHGPDALAALGVADASERNCGAASWGKAKGAGLGKLAGSGEMAPDEAEVDWAGAGPGFDGGIESAKAGRATLVMTRAKAFLKAARR
jgi:hypothetical protein